MWRNINLLACLERRAAETTKQTALKCEWEGDIALATWVQAENAKVSTNNR